MHVAFVRYGRTIYKKATRVLEWVHRSPLFPKFVQCDIWLLWCHFADSLPPGIKDLVTVGTETLFKWKAEEERSAMREAGYDVPPPLAAFEADWQSFYSSDTSPGILLEVLDDSVQEALTRFLRPRRYRTETKGEDSGRNKHNRVLVNTIETQSVFEHPRILFLKLLRYTCDWSGLIGRPDDQEQQKPKRNEKCITIQSTIFVGDQLYTLRSFVCHEGESPDSGHYVAYAIAPTGDWWFFNDQIGRKVGNSKMDTVLNGGPGMDPPAKTSSQTPSSSQAARIPCQDVYFLCYERDG
eukprot:Hpha_TRINITY_DN16075_c0_g5::TRINITY_DN16075_c0_g5_i2::g.116892::m.116892